MKVFLILSLALVLLVSVSFAGPAARVILPAYVSEDIAHEKRETIVEDEADESFNPFQVVEVPVDDGSQPKVVPLVSAFGLKKTQLQMLYEKWIPKVPPGENSSFQAFLNWMKKEEAKENSKNTGDQKQLVESERSVDDDDEEPKTKHEAALEFGLTETELDELYQFWLQKVPAGKESSFAAFLDWMEEEDDKNDIIAESGLTETELDERYQFWLQKVPAGKESSFAAFLDWMEDEMEKNDKSTDDDVVGAVTKENWLKAIEKAFEKKEPRSWEEEQSQGSLTDRDQLPSFKPAPKSAANEYEDLTRKSVEDESKEEIAAAFQMTVAELETVYLLWLPKVPAGDDSSFPAFAKWMKENDDPVNDGAVGVGTHFWRSVVKWGSKVVRWVKKVTKKEFDSDGQQLEEVQRSDDVNENGKVEDESKEEIAADFKMTVAELETVFGMWVPKVPVGEDSSFQAFIRWMKENDDAMDDDAVGVGTHFWRSVVKWGSRVVRWVKKVTKKEFDADGQQLAEVQRSDDDKEDTESGEDLSREEIAADFKMTVAELETVYRMWVRKVPVGDDSSFQAFTQWLKENDDPVDNSPIGVGTHFWRSVVKWGGRIHRWYKKVTKIDKKEFDADGQQQLTEFQQSADEEQSEINQELSARAFGKYQKWGAGDNYFSKKSKKENIADEQQLTEVQKSDDFNGKTLLKAYRKWLKTVREEKDKTFQKFAEFYLNRKTRSLENELGDDSQTKEEEEEESPDTNGGYSCETNSPCNIENVINEEFYFATTSDDKFIQCDAWGGCHTLTCDEDLVWDDLIKTCGLRI